MLYPFMTLNDGTEIVYSSPIQNGNQEQVKVQIETPVENGFKSATCILPGYLWTNNGYSEMEMASLKELVKSTAHLLILTEIRQICVKPRADAQFSRFFCNLCGSTFRAMGLLRFHFFPEFCRYLLCLF